MLLSDIITQGSQNTPQNTALVFRDQSMTYAELAVAVARFAAGLRSLGIGQGDRIALLLPNCPPFVLGYFAAGQIGAVVVPSNPLLKSAELEYIWRDAQIKLVLTAAPLLPNVQAARAALPTLKHIVSITPQTELPDTLPAQATDGLLFFTDIMMRGAAVLARDGRPPFPTVHEQDCAVVLYTSGTTGHPKGAMLSHKNLTRNVEQVRAVLHITPEDTFLTVLPLFHSFAGTVCMNLPLACGSATILLENFQPARTVEAIEKHKATIFPAVPAIFNALLQYSQSAPFDTSTLRAFVSGGAPLPAAILNTLETKFGVPVLEGDGPTECSPVTSVNPIDGIRKVGSVGPQLPGVEVAIFDEADRILPVDAVGEIVVRGDNVMIGYLNQPEATAEVMTGGWYHTGDIGSIDTDGYIFILDRKKDMIITAGLNVYPREIEEVLLTHPAVADAAVIGQADAARGEEVVAVVILRAGDNGEQNFAVTVRELISYCRERLANYKVPRRLVFRDALPRGSTGKVVKRLLRKEMELETKIENENRGGMT